MICTHFSQTTIGFEDWKEVSAIQSCPTSKSAFLTTKEVPFRHVAIFSDNLVLIPPSVSPYDDVELPVEERKEDRRDGRGERS